MFCLHADPVRLVNVFWLTI